MCTLFEHLEPLQKVFAGTDLFFCQLHFESQSGLLDQGGGVLFDGSVFTMTSAA